MIYCDTSLLVSALLSTERASEDADAWLAGQEQQGLAVSAWVNTEFASALAMKIRRGELERGASVRILRTWSVLRESFAWLAIEPRHFERAAAILIEPGSRLRSGDALHLALALEHGCTLVTLDSDLFDAAAALGISAGPISTPS